MKLIKSRLFKKGEELFFLNENNNEELIQEYSDALK